MAGKFMQQAANRDYSKWWQKEGTWPWIFQQPKPPITGRPYPVYENYNRVMRGEQPYWMPAYMDEINIIWPDAMEEHPVPEINGPDWWGVEWFMETRINGMMVKPDTRTISDFANWKEELEWPDLSVVDFETDGKKIAASLDPDEPMFTSVLKVCSSVSTSSSPLTNLSLLSTKNPSFLKSSSQSW